MKRSRISISIALAAVLAATQARAVTTWAPAGPQSRSAEATYTTPSSESAPSSAAWAAGTTYAAGDTVVYAGLPWVSLQGSNTGRIPSIAASATWWSLVGLDLSSVRAWAFTVCAAGASAYVSTGGTWTVYFFSMTKGKWAKTDWTITMPASASGVPCSSSRGDSPGWGLPNLFPSGRLALVPSGAVASDAGSVTGTMEALESSGRAL